jgi:hypothetical protein
MPMPSTALSTAVATAARSAAFPAYTYVPAYRCWRLGEGGRDVTGGVTGGALTLTSSGFA